MFYVVSDDLKKTIDKIRDLTRVWFSRIPNSHFIVERFTWMRIGREKFPLSLNIIAQTLELELD